MNLIKMIVIWGLIIGIGLILQTEMKGEEEMETKYAQLREQMVQQQMMRRGVKDSLVLNAMRTVPRHLFVPSVYRDQAYEDHPLPIGHEQTISQPYIVAFMTETLQLDGTEKVLEIGTGSGYQAAVLSEIVDSVYTIEIVEPLALETIDLLKELHYTDVTAKIGDGYQGWQEYAPFDAIIVTAAPDHIPQPLVDQLKVGGKMIIPVGTSYQELMLIEKKRDGGITKRSVLPVRFVPMTGEAQEK